MDVSKTPVVAHIDDVLRVVEKIRLLDPDADKKILRHMKLNYAPTSRLAFYLQGAENIAIIAELLHSPAFLRKEMPPASNAADMILPAVQGYLETNPHIEAQLECRHNERALFKNRAVNFSQIPCPTFA